jgi:hypothetical protein
MSSHVCLTSRMEVLSRFILVAITLSSVSLVLMALIHRDLISVTVWERSFITRLQRSTQIRCADSDIMICRSLFFPLLFVLPSFWLQLLLSLLFLGMVRLPQPRIVPRLISGHSSGEWGHLALARGHMVLTGSAVQPIRICSMDSVVRHLEHWPLVLYPGMFVQKLPIMYALCMALYMNCCTHGVTSQRLVLLDLSVFGYLVFKDPLPSSAS